jgi:hypothetical protein
VELAGSEVERSVVVTKTGLAAGNGHMGTQAQAVDVRAAVVAHLGHQRHILEADGSPWGAGEKSGLLPEAELHEFLCPPTAVLRVTPRDIRHVDHQDGLAGPKRG